MYEQTESSVQGAHGELISIVNDTDSQGLPAGGHALGRGLSVQFQPGPVKEVGAVVGAFVEDLLVVAINRLEWYQSGRFACAENGRAIEMMNGALDLLNERTAERRKRGVEGQHKE